MYDLVNFVVMPHRRAQSVSEKSKFRIDQTEGLNGQYAGDEMDFIPADVFRRTP